MSNGRFDCNRCKKGESDVFRIVDFVEFGRLGGLKGGPARARVLSHEERVIIARKGAMARWGGRV